jgi:hypothetical protein
MGKDETAVEMWMREQGIQALDRETKMVTGLEELKRRIKELACT